MTWTCINHKIFIGFTQFLLGPKYNGKFVIDCARDHKRSDVVRLRGAFAGASLAVYFDSRIRIASCLYGPDGAKYSNVFLTYQDAGDGMPDDLDAYIHECRPFWDRALVLWLHAGSCTSVAISRRCHLRDGRGCVILGGYSAHAVSVFGPRSFAGSWFMDVLTEIPPCVRRFQIIK